MAEDGEKQPKRLSEIDVLRKVDRLFADLDAAAQRRVAFYFADRVGLKFEPPVNGHA